MANCVETEQLIELSSPKGTVLSSFVQLRGSIPLMWSQIPNIKYKPTTRIAPPDTYARAFDRHVTDLLDIYKVGGWLQRCAGGRYGHCPSKLAVDLVRRCRWPAGWHAAKCCSQACWPSLAGCRRRQPDQPAWLGGRAVPGWLLPVAAWLQMWQAAAIHAIVLFWFWACCSFTCAGTQALEKEAGRFAKSTSGFRLISFDFHRQCGAKKYHKCAPDKHNAQTRNNGSVLAPPPASALLTPRAPCGTPRWRAAIVTSAGLCACTSAASS